MSASATQVKKVMISSTVRDLPEHRKQVMDACQRMSVFPEHMMENLTAEDANAVEVSLRLVNVADIYIGVFAHRYGFVPDYDNPNSISITEMEYNRAVERGIPRLIFFMHDNHDLKKSDVETGPGAEKLEALKKRIGNERVAAFFNSPEDLRAHVIQSLSQLKEKLKDHDAPPQFHYVHPIPVPPEPYIAHPYTLLQAHGLFGRQQELSLLTDWIRGKGLLAQIRIFNLIAIGGMGKSALVWHWFQNIVPLEMPNMAGRFWWSFYESDAYFENFVVRALAYVSGRSIGEVQQIDVVDRESELLRILDREPHLLVLDGLERILIAYTRMDAAHLADDDYDKQTANWVARAAGLPESAAQSFTGEHRLRKTADPRAGKFLRKLARVEASHILVSSRLYPFDLQMLNGEPGPGCSAIFLRGLNDNDAFDLWDNFSASDRRDELQQLFRTFENHPLLIQALASEVARYRPAPGDFDRWRKDKPNFNPFSLPLKQAKSHILLHALHGLNNAERQTLRTMAAFRMPTQYDTLRALLIGADKPCATEQELDALLNELEDRGLLGWDRRANRYDLHPVVRGVVWTDVPAEDKLAAFASLQGFFEAISVIGYWKNVSSIEELIPAIELYNSLIELHRCDDAEIIFYERLDKATLYRIGAGRLRIELIERLFPRGLEFPPALIKPAHQAYIYNALALSYQNIGMPGKSLWLYGKKIDIQKKLSNPLMLAAGYTNKANALLHCGYLYDAFILAKNALVIAIGKKEKFRKAVSLYMMGISEAATGKWDQSGRYLNDSKHILIETGSSQLVVMAFFAQRALWHNDFKNAQRFANRAWQMANERRYAYDFIIAARLQGQAALAFSAEVLTKADGAKSEKNWPAGTKALADEADERLHHALTRARAINYVEEELPALIALAELRRLQGKPKEAHALLDDVWEAAERGPYPLFHADACNVLCRIERDAGNAEKAIAAATRAYRLAWCDGPPWAYQYGLENAKKHLRELGAALPEMEKEE